MKTISTVLMCSTLALSGGAALAKDATQAPAARRVVAKEASAPRRAVALSDAELSDVVAGNNPAAGYGIATALSGPSTSTPNYGAANAINGIVYHAIANAHTCFPGLGQATAAC
jgi:hypothetical protein